MTMKKKLIALATALTFVSALPTLAAPTASKLPVPFKVGTLTSWDAAAKRGVVKDSKGVETSFVWDEKTKVAGTAKVGEHAYVWYKQDKDGTVTATNISIGTRLAMKKAEPPKAAVTPAAK